MESPLWHRAALKEFRLSGRRSAYYFNLEVIKERLRFLRSLSDHATFFLFPVKSFPHPRLLQLAAQELAGFDVSNHNEFRLIEPFLTESHQLWVSSPCDELLQLGRPALQDLNSVEACQAVSAWERVSLRVKPSFLQPDNRFGVTPDKAQRLLTQYPELKAVHVHLSGIQNQRGDYLQLLQHMRQLLGDAKGLRLNFGGGFCRLNFTDIADLVTQARALFPQAQLFFEPGRWLAEPAGIAVGKILSVEAPHVTTTLSPSCHLRWMPAQFNVYHAPGRAAHGETNPLPHSLYGPTCFEGDKLAELNVPVVRVGDLIYVDRVAGYSWAWGHSFNGIDPADLIFWEQS